MRFIASLLLVTAFAGCLAGDDTPTPPPRVYHPEAMVFHNGTIWTGAGTPFVEAAAIEGSFILATGAEATVLDLVGPDAELVDLHGGMLLPGFHDTHNHLLDYVAGSTTGVLFDDDPADPTPTTYDPTTGPGMQQVIGGLHVCHWGVQHAQSEIEASVAVQPNLARDACYQGAAPAGSEMVRRLQSVEAVAASFGITSHVQAGWEVEDLEAIAQLDPRLRWNLYLWPEGLESAVSNQWATGTTFGEMRLLGIKIYGDGWLGPRTAAMHSDFGDRPHNGFQFYEQAELNDVVLQAREAGLKVTAHAIGERAVDAMLSAYEASANAVGCTTSVACFQPRFSLEHASVLGADAIDRMVALGVVPSIQLSFPTSDAHWIDSAVTSAHGDPYPWQTMVDAGLFLAGSSDWPIEALPPLWGIERAVTRQEVDESLPGPWQVEEAVSVDTALRMVTINAAYLEFREGQLGSIQPGKLADLVVLEQDLFQVDPSTIADVKILQTYVDGQLVYDA